MKKRVLKDRLIFILYNLVIVFVFLAISEGVAAFWLNNPSRIPSSLLPAFRFYYTEHLRSTIQMEPSCAVYDPELFYTLRPGKSNFSNIEFNTPIFANSKGVRDDEESLDAPELIMLGDSFTMGWGVPQDSTYASHIEHALNTRILNAGISSYGTVREMTIMKRFDLRNLKTVVIQYHESDIDENRAFKERGDSLVISSRETLEGASERVRKRARYFFGKHTAFLTKFILKGILGRLENGRQTGRDDVNYFLHALNSLNSKDSLNLVVFELSNYGRSNNNFVNELESALATTDFPFQVKNVKVVNVQKELGPADYFILDNHINCSGHKKVSLLLETVLKNLDEH